MQGNPVMAEGIDCLVSDRTENIRYQVIAQQPRNYLRSCKAKPVVYLKVCILPSLGEMHVCSD